jgi:predicted nucleotidyltransferase
MTAGEIGDALTRVLAAREGAVAAYLFGSFADGRAHRESDVDIGILLDRQRFATAAARFDERMQLTGRLRGAVDREVDLVILNDAPPQLGRHIMMTGRRLFANDAEADHAHRRTTLSRAADIEPFLRRTRAVKLRALAR